MPHDVDAEARDAGNDVREVGAVLLFEAHQRGARHDLFQCFFDELRRQRLGPQVVQLAVQTNARRIAGDEVQVRAVLGQHFLQELVDLPRHKAFCVVVVGAAWLGSVLMIDQPGARSSLGNTLVSVTKRANSFLSFAYT